MRDKEKIIIYESLMEDIDLEIIDYKKKIAELRKARKRYYLKIYYLKNKKGIKNRK